MTMKSQSHGFYLSFSQFQNMTITSQPPCLLFELLPFLISICEVEIFLRKSKKFSVISKIIVKKGVEQNENQEKVII